jgi:acetylornithine deacetylase
VTTPTTDERRALDAVDFDWQLGLLGRMLALRSDQGNESAMQRLMAATMSDIGMEVDAWEIDLETLRHDPHHSEEIHRTEALGVVGTYGSGAGPTLALNGHVDVVGPGVETDWTQPIWELTVAEGCAYGRGAVDMKGSMSCALAAIRALRTAGVAIAGTIAVQSVVGEEDGGTGTLATIRRGHRADAAIVLEPTELQIATAHCGALCFRVRVRGLSAHACMRDEGVSAIAKAGVLLGTLDALEARRNARVDHQLLAVHANPLPISVGTIHGGEWPSSVPDEVVFEGRYGVAPGEDMDVARTELETTIAACANADTWLRAHPPEVTWFGGRFEPAETSVGADFIAVLQEAAGTVADRSIDLCAATYGADMRLHVNVAGIPTVMYGPGDVRRAHAPDEYVPLTDLLACTRTLVLMAMRYCGVT